MNIQFDKRKLGKLVRAFSWCAVLLFIGFTTRGILFDGVLAGWDTQGHLYLAQETSMQIRNGQLMFFDEKWFAGYPAFPLYGPLFYYLVSLLSIVTFSVFSIPLLFNSVIYSFSFLFIFAFVFASKQWFGKSVELFALFGSLLFLLPSKLHNAYGIGIASYTMAGLIPSFLGIILLTLFIGLLKWVIDDKVTKKIVFTLSLLLALTFYANPTTGVFAAFCFLIIGFFGRKKIKTFLIIGGLGCLLLLPYFIGLFRYLPYASSSSIGYSEVATMPLSAVLFFQINQLTILNPAVISEFGLYAIPVIGCIVFIAFLIGVYASFKKKIYGFTILYLVSLVIVFFELNMGVLQSFRFITLLYLIQLFLVTFGLYSLFLWGKKKKVSYPTIILVLVIFVLGGHQLFFHQYDLLRDEGYHRLQHYRFSVEDYRQYDALDDLITYLEKKQTVNRVAIDSTMYMLAELGGIHSGSSHLAQNGYNAIPGLLAESSLSSTYLIPVMEALDLSIPWGRRTLLDTYKKSDLEFNDHLKRLELFGVDTIVAFNPGAKSLFAHHQNEALFTEEFSTDVFTVYELQNAKPVIDIPEFKPIVFVSSSTSVFREFTEEWFLHTELLSYPVILVHPKKIDEILEQNGERVGGLIVDGSFETQLRSIDYDRKEKISSELALWIKETQRYDQTDDSLRIERKTFTPDENSRGGYWVSPSFVLYLEQGKN